jgi:hypothetical protein
MSKSTPAIASSVEINSTTSSVVSLWLVLHILCVVCVLSASVNPSALQNRLATVFAPYSQTLHLHPGDVRFPIVSSDALSDEHFLVLETQSGTTKVRLPDQESTLGLERQRLTAICTGVAYFAERDELAGYYARAVGGKLLRELQQNRAVIRCVQKLSQPMDLAYLEPGFPPDNPDASEYFYTVYEAEVWIDEDGELNLQKRSVGRNAAPTATRSSNPSTKSNPAETPAPNNPTAP